MGVPDDEDSPCGHRRLATGELRDRDQPVRVGQGPAGASAPLEAVEDLGRQRHVETGRHPLAGARHDDLPAGGGIHQGWQLRRSDPRTIAAAPLPVVLGLARLIAEFPFNRGQQGRQLIDHRRPQPGQLQAEILVRHQVAQPGPTAPVHVGMTAEHLR